MASDEVRWMDIDNQGVVWLGTGNGLAKLQNGTITNQSIGTGNDPQTVVVSKKDKLGTIWVGTYGAFSSPTFRLDNGVWTKLLNVAGNVSVNSANDIKEDHLGRIWIGASSGAFLYSRTTEVDPLEETKVLVSCTSIESGQAIIFHSHELQSIRCYDALGKEIPVQVKNQVDQTLVSGLPSQGMALFRLSEEKGNVWTLRSMAY